MNIIHLWSKPVQGSNMSFMSEFSKYLDFAFGIFMDEWLTHIPDGIDSSDQLWLRKYGKVLIVKKGDLLYTPADQQRYAYFTCDGLLAKVSFKESFKESLKQPSDFRRILLTVAPPRQVLLSSYHLYNRSGSLSDIVALRRSIVICIPYSIVIARYEVSPSFNLFFNVLRNRKMKQIQNLRRLETATSMQEKYFMFADNMPDLRNILTQQEEGDLLDISLRSVKRHSKNYLKRKES